MTRRSMDLLLTSLLCLVLAACGANEPPPDLSNDPLVGGWSPVGIEIDSKPYAFEDVPEIAGLYDGNILSIFEDGTFTYIHAIFFTEGTWTTSWMESVDRAYTLMSESVCTMGFEGGELVFGEKSEKDEQYRVWLLNEDSETLAFTDADINAVVYYTQSGEPSAYLNPSDSVSPEEPAPQPESTPPPTAETVTMGMRNALETAHSYLDVMAFSYSGLFDQLEYEGYTHEEALYAVDHCGADWYEQAALKAWEYLEVMSFSRAGLIEQLEYEGFTYDQAVYGVEQAGY